MLTPEQLLELVEQTSLSVCHIIKNLDLMQRGAGQDMRRELGQMLRLRATLMAIGQSLEHDPGIEEDA